MYLSPNEQKIGTEKLTLASIIKFRNAVFNSRNALGEVSGTSMAGRGLLNQPREYLIGMLSHVSQLSDDSSKCIDLCFE